MCIQFKTLMSHRRRRWRQAKTSGSQTGRTTLGADLSRVTSVTSLSMAIEASGSPLGPHAERDLAIDLYFGSTLIPIKYESNRRISFIQLQKIYNVATRCNQGMGLSFGNPSKNRSHCGSILWCYPDSQLQWDHSTWPERPFQVMKHLADLSLSWGRLTR
jgi:hypothetical protein